MNLRTAFILNTYVSILFGVGLLTSPQTLVQLLDITLDPVACLFAQLFGMTLILTGLLSWWIRDAPKSSIRDAVTRAFMIGDMIGFVVVAGATQMGVGNQLNWAVAALFVFFTFCWAYF